MDGDLASGFGGPSLSAFIGVHLRLRVPGSEFRVPRRWMFMSFPLCVLRVSVVNFRSSKALTADR